MPSMSSNNGPSQRQLRVGELLRKVLSSIILRGELQAPELDGVILSITEVSVSPDLKQATAFVAPLGDADEAQILEVLQRHRKYVRGIVARQVDLKYMPEISFKIDDSVGRAERIDALLRTEKVAQDLK